MTKILIVEDEEAISNLIRMSLCKTGYICEQAFDGETAADLIAENSYDLILLDIMLPAMNCLTISRRHKCRSFLLRRWARWMTK